MITNYEYMMYMFPEVFFGSLFLLGIPVIFYLFYKLLVHVQGGIFKDPFEIPAYLLVFFVVSILFLIGIFNVTAPFLECGDRQYNSVKQKNTEPEFRIHSRQCLQDGKITNFEYRVLSHRYVKMLKNRKVMEVIISSKDD